MKDPLPSCEHEHAPESIEALIHQEFRQCIAPGSSRSAYLAESSQNAGAFFKEERSQLDEASVGGKAPLAVWFTLLKGAITREDQSQEKTARKRGYSHNIHALPLMLQAAQDVEKKFKNQETKDDAETLNKWRAEVNRAFTSFRSLTGLFKKLDAYIASGKTPKYESKDTAEIHEAGSSEFECQECDRKFKKKLTPSTTDVKCPKCGSYDTLPTDFFGSKKEGYTEGAEVDFKAAAASLLKKSTGTTQEDIHYRAFLHAVRSGRSTQHLMKFPGAKAARDDVVDLTGKGVRENQPVSYMYDGKPKIEGNHQEAGILSMTPGSHPKPKMGDIGMQRRARYLHKVASKGKLSGHQAVELSQIVNHFGKNFGKDFQETSTSESSVTMKKAKNENSVNKTLQLGLECLTEANSTRKKIDDLEQKIGRIEDELDNIDVMDPENSAGRKRHLELDKELKRLKSEWSRLREGTVSGALSEAKCVDCGKPSDRVSTREVPTVRCSSCWKKHTQKSVDKVKKSESTAEAKAMTGLPDIERILRQKYDRAVKAGKPRVAAKLAKSIKLVNPKMENIPDKGKKNEATLSRSNPSTYHDGAWGPDGWLDKAKRKFEASLKRESPPDMNTFDKDTPPGWLQKVKESVQEAGADLGYEYLSQVKAALAVKADKAWKSAKKGEKWPDTDRPKYTSGFMQGIRDREAGKYRVSNKDTDDPRQRGYNDAGWGKLPMESKTITILRDALNESHSCTVDGREVDVFTAGQVLSVYDSIRPELQETFSEQPISQMVSIAFQATE